MMENLEKLAAEQGYRLVPVQTPSEIVGNHASSLHGTAQLLAASVFNGGKPDKRAKDDLRIVKAYIEAVLAGEIPNPADIYCKAMEDVE